MSVHVFYHYTHYYARPITSVFSVINDALGVGGGVKCGEEGEGGGGGGVPSPVMVMTARMEESCGNLMEVNKKRRKRKKLEPKEEKKEKKGSKGNKL